MHAPLFFQPEIEELLITLPPEESKHCIRVLRLGKDDRVDVTDGMGNLYKTRIIEPNPKKTVLSIFETFTDTQKHDGYIHMAVALTKNISRYEWFIEKATEIGIDEITPVICINSERKTVKMDRLRKVMISAMKQSQKCWLPKLNKPVVFSVFIDSHNTENQFIAHIGAHAVTPLAQLCPKRGEVSVLIGPEGDFTEEEVDVALQKGFRVVSLGNSRLRTETAAIVACHTIHVVNTK